MKHFRLRRHHLWNITHARFLGLISSEAGVSYGTLDLGPDLTHLGSRRTLGAGIMEHSLGNEALWVLDSQAIKPGNQMPPMDLSCAELSTLMAFFETLE